VVFPLSRRNSVSMAGEELSGILNSHFIFQQEFLFI